MQSYATITGRAPEYREKRGLRTLVSLCVAPAANMAIHAADCTANLQVFCRKNSGNRYPGFVCLWSLLVRGACGQAWRVTHGKIGRLRNTEGSPLSIVVIWMRSRHPSLIERSTSVRGSPLSSWPTSRFWMPIWRRSIPPRSRASSRRRRCRTAGWCSGPRGRHRVL